MSNSLEDLFSKATGMIDEVDVDREFQGKKVDLATALMKKEFELDSLDNTLNNLNRETTRYTSQSDEARSALSRIKDTL